MKDSKLDQTMAEISLFNETKAADVVKYGNEFKDLTLRYRFYESIFFFQQLLLALPNIGWDRFTRAGLILIDDRNDNMMLRMNLLYMFGVWDLIERTEKQRIISEEDYRAFWVCFDQCYAITEIEVQNDDGSVKVCINLTSFWYRLMESKIEREKDDSSAVRVETELLSIRTLIENQNLSTKEYFTFDEVAELMSVSINTVYGWSSKRLFPTYKLGGKVTYVKRSELFEALEKNKKLSKDELVEKAKETLSKS